MRLHRLLRSHLLRTVFGLTHLLCSVFIGNATQTCNIYFQYGKESFEGVVVKFMLLIVYIIIWKCMRTIRKYKMSNEVSKRENDRRAKNNLENW